MTRVREPLDYYLSFYRWGVAFRQREDPASFGSNFLEWARRVPNLQSTMMVQSMAAMAAEYHINQYMMNYNGRRPGAAIGNTEEAAWHKLMAFLDQFTIVGTMKRFDESLLLAHDLVGLPILLYKRNRPNQKGGYAARIRMSARTWRPAGRRSARLQGGTTKCSIATMPRLRRSSRSWGRSLRGACKRISRYANMCMCMAALILASHHFSHFFFVVCFLLYAAGDRGDTEHMEEGAAEAIHLQIPSGDDDKRARLRPLNIRCPVKDGGTELCQSVYAHRLFECPWQYVPNSTLSDPLGCWRPSSGFK